MGRQGLKTKLFFVTLILMVGGYLVLGLHQDDIFISISRPEEVYQKKNMLIYFGRDSCPNCRLAEKIIEPYFSEKKLKLYYFDTDLWRNDENFENIIEHFQIVEVPTLLWVNNQVIMARLELVDQNGKISVERIENFLGEVCYE